MTVLAHGVGQSQDLPLPLDLVLQAGAATIVVSFLGVALLWRRPRLAGGIQRWAPGSSTGVSAGTRRPGWWLSALRLTVLAVAIWLIGCALAGPRDGTNPMAHAVFVWLWVGLVPVSIVFGPVWRAVNPLRTLYRLARLSRLHAVADSAAVARFGGWSAALSLFGFVWLELLAPGRTDPRVLGACAVAYAVMQLALAARFGEEWLAAGDCFEVYSELAGRLSPLRWRPWLSGLAADHGGPARATFLAIWWGSTVFDSAHGSPVWAGFVQSTGYATLLGTVGLVGICAIVLAGVRGKRFDAANALIPIAAGYTLAHYLTLLIVEAPRGLLLWARQPAETWNPAVAPAFVSLAQVALILAGHTLGVIAAHDRALAPADGLRRTPLATLADEFPVVLFMIACTWAGLFLLFVR